MVVRLFAAQVSHVGEARNVESALGGELERAQGERRTAARVLINNAARTNLVFFAYFS